MKPVDPKKEKLHKRKRSERQGRRAEFFVKCWLMLHGYRPVESRYKSGFGEIDLVMHRGRKILFIEVKYRTQQKDFQSALPPFQADRILKASHAWISQNQHIATSIEIFQIDVIFVSPFKIPFRIKNALSLSDQNWQSGL